MLDKRVVIIGGGFGGLSAALKLRHSVTDIGLIDRTNHHLFQPLLYQVATGAIRPSDIAINIRELFHHQENVTVLLDEVDEIQPDNKQLIVKRGASIHYDQLIIATGARHTYFGNDQWEKFAPGLKTLSDAIEMRDRIFMCFEEAERKGLMENMNQHLRFVIVGAGPTGVELAGAIAEIAFSTLKNDFRRIDPANAKIFLVNSGDRVLGTFTEELSEKAEKHLEELGVEVLSGARVTDVQADGVKIGDEFVPADNIFWAAGNQASPLLKSLNQPLDPQGRAIVTPSLTLPDYPDIFVVGDAASFTPEGEERPLPAVAPTAIQQGTYVANLIAKEIDPTQAEPFKYTDKGSMATIGKRKAIAHIGKLQCSGFFAWILWSVVHLHTLMLSRNKVFVFMSWFISYFSNSRVARLIRYKPVNEDEK